MSVSPFFLSAVQLYSVSKKGFGYCWVIFKKTLGQWTPCIGFCQNLSNIFSSLGVTRKNFVSFLFPWFCIYMLASLFLRCFAIPTRLLLLEKELIFCIFFSFFLPCIDFTLHESDEGEIQRKLESINHIMSQEWNYQPPNQELGAPRSRMYPSHCKFLYFICLSLFTNVCPETTLPPIKVWCM